MCSPRRSLAWGSVVLAAGLLPFSAALGERTLAKDMPTLQTLVPHTEHLRLEVPNTVIEGQPFIVKLAWKDIPAATRVKKTSLRLEIKTQSHDGKVLDLNQTLELGATHQTQRLVIPVAGPHTLKVFDSNNTLWAQHALTADAFPASVFPQHQAKYPVLSKNPADYHIWVNLHHEAKQQRQYAQITYKGQILERLLISSGAVGHDTPRGDFKVGFKEYYPRSARYGDTPMPFWSAININGNEGEYGFHALDSGGYMYALGKPASHGCIRLSRLAALETHPETGEKYWGDRGGARWIYDHVPENTPISIFNHAVNRFAFEDYAQHLHQEARKRLQKNKAQT